MSYKFSVGDIVRIDKKLLIGSTNRYLPTWYTSKSFTIIKVLDDYDIENYPIVLVDIDLEDCSENSGSVPNEISTKWLLLDTREIRKRKLERLENMCDGCVYVITFTHQ